MTENENESLSYMSVIPHLKMLRIAGVFPLDLSSPKFKKRLQIFYMWFYFFLIMLYTVLQFIYVFKVSDDLDKVMDAMFLLLTFLDSIFKQIMFLMRPHKILEIVNIMKGPSFNQGLDEHQPLLLGTIKHSLFLLQFFNIICLATCFLWILFDLISHFKNETVEFTIWLPFDTNEIPQFYIAICYVWLQTSWLGLSNSTMDVFIFIMYLHTKTQLSILRLNLENLVIRCRKEAITTSRPFTEVLEYRFKEIIHHYDDIILFSNLIESVFSGPLLFQFLVSGWIICTTAYRTISMDPASGEFYSMIIYMNCIVSEICLFCHYGNDVAYESEKLVESAYCMEWEEIPVKYRRYLIIFMERVKCSILPKAGKIVPMSMNTFIQIVRTSYTFYTFLKSS